MATATPTQVMITPDDRGPAVNVVAWITMCSMILAVLTKLGGKLQRSRTLMVDDLLATLAMIFAVAQVIAISMGVANGLGQRQYNLNSHQIANVERAQFAAEILYIMAITMSKLVTIRFLSVLAPFEEVLKLTNITYGVTAIWCLIAILGAAFQCPVPNTWTIFSSKCFNQTAFWLAIGIVDILIEIVLVALPIYVLRPIDLPKPSKVSVLIAFTSRVVVIPIIIVRLYYIDFARKSNDRTFDEYGAIMATQVQMTLVIVLCCFPFLKTFLDSLQSGYLASDLTVAPTALFSHGSSRTRSVNLLSGNSTKNRDSIVERAETNNVKRTPSARPIKEGRDSDTSFGSEEHMDRRIAVETTVTIDHEDSNSPRGDPSGQLNRATSYKQNIRQQLTGWS